MKCGHCVLRHREVDDREADEEHRDDDAERLRGTQLREFRDRDASNLPDEHGYHQGDHGAEAQRPSAHSRGGRRAGCSTRRGSRRRRRTMMRAADRTRRPAAAPGSRSARRSGGARPWANANDAAGAEPRRRSHDGDSRHTPQRSAQPSPRTISTTFSPHSVGFCATATPAADSASILAWAVPDEPEMMAPAWPILRPGGRRHPGDVGGDRLGHVGRDELRRPLLLRAADLADHHDRLRLGVLLEGVEAVDEVRARDRVAADAHARGLPDALLRELVQRLVGQGARPRDDAHRPARQRDVARGDADVALPGADDAGAVRAEQAGVGELLRPGGCTPPPRPGRGCPR